MSFRITRYESTPNPNALKCWLDQPISDHPQSFLNADMARDHALAAALFDTGVITTLLFNGNWMTINKSPATVWPTAKRRVEAVLADAPS
ncbi:MAG: NifU N-terminal domain-containing protein [Phycisphaerales bacterium]|nr:NifU N-terminal domain-containing protein [Phycisphaerales bacterium]